jgi:hypothetical protein
MCAISPAAWIAVVTSSGPFGGPAGLRGGSGGGGGGAGREVRRWAFSALAARDAAVERVAVGFGFAGFAAAAGGRFGAAFADVACDVLAAPRRPSRSGRVEGRLASTPSCAAADFLGFFALVGLSVMGNGWNARAGTQYSQRTRFVESGKYRA